MVKEINPEYSLEGLMMRLKLQYFGHLMGRADSLEKILILGKIEGRRRRERQDEMFRWHHQLNGHESEQHQGDSYQQRSLMCSSSWSCKESDMTEQLNNKYVSDKHTDEQIKKIRCVCTHKCIHIYYTHTYYIYNYIHTIEYYSFKRRKKS